MAEQSNPSLAAAQAVPDFETAHNKALLEELKNHLVFLDNQNLTQQVTAAVDALKNQRCQVLVVDDEVEITRTLYRQLRKSCDVFIANNTAEAQEILNNQVIHIIICDQRMPQVNGTDFLATVRPYHPCTQFILLTAYSDMDLVIKAINQGGVYRYFAKPWHIAELNSAVQQGFDRYCLQQTNQLLAQLFAKLTQEKKQVIEDLQTHKIELEMQADELRTEQQRVQEANSRFYELYHHAPIGFLTLNAQGRIEEYNYTFLNMLGYSNRKLPKNFLHELMPSTEKNSFILRYKSFFKTPKTVETQLKTATNQLLDVSLELCAEHYKGIENSLLVAVIDITARKQAEQQLQQSETMLKTILDSSMDGIAVANAETLRFSFFNQALCQMLGYTSEEMRVLTVPELHDVADLPRIEAEISTLKQGINKLITELPFIRKDGKKIFTDDSASFLELNGKPHIMGIFRDITERKQQQNALTEAHNLLKTIIDTVPLGIYWKDNALAYLGCNQRFLNDACLSSEAELIGKSDEQLSWSDHSTANRDDDLAVLAKGVGKLHCEQSLFLPDDSVVWLDNSKVPLKNANREIFGLVGVYEDITQRKNLEQALIAREKRYRVLMELAGDALFVADVETGKIIDCNAKACSLIGCDKQEIIGLHQIELHPAEKRAEYQQVFQQASKEGQSLVSDVLALHKDGHSIPVDISSNTFELDNKKVIVGLFHDISEHKRMAEFLQKAKQTADQANQAKSEFLANMSHEIRTPMNAILGFSDILKDLITDSQQWHYLDSIERSGKTLLQLINDILDLSKIEAGKLTLTYTPVSINYVLQDIRVVFEQKLLEKNLTMSVLIDENLPKDLLLDEIRLRQILLNLVGNAVKFTEVGGIKILVFVSSVNTESVNLDIEVRDTGMGIPKNQQEKIFNAFTQQEQQSVTYGGTGLGLTICKRLLSLMGGSISLESEPGKGSCFTVHLNHVKTSDGSVGINKTSRPLSRRYHHFEPATILVVDDVAFNRDLIKSYLSEFDELHLLEAETGEQALEIAQQQVFGLVLMDRRLPGEDGDSICRKIKAMPHHANTPIIMITASVLTVKEQQLPVAFDLQLDKPLKKCDLITAMQRFLPLNKNASTEPVNEEKQPSNIDDELMIEDLPLLLEVLTNHYHPQISSLRSIGFIPINELIETADGLLIVSKQHCCRKLEKWAVRLKEQAEFCFVDELPKTLLEFDSLLEEIKNTKVH